MKIHYVSGSRADFGLVARTLTDLHALPGFEVNVVATGQHLLASYGHTQADIMATGLPIAGDIPVDLSGAEGAEMGRALAAELLGFLNLWARDRPDLVLVLGDRGEMLAATLAAVHLGVHVAHLHGGELSGTLDESFRHAISKLAHFHFAANRDAADRLIRMGERADRIWVVGAPGLVGLTETPVRPADWLSSRFALPHAQHQALIAFHPVVQEAASAAAQIRALLETLKAQECTGLVMRPNSDAGGAEIDAYLDQVSELGWFAVCKHLERDDYLSVLAEADIIVGNSSSGIIESASFGTPCLNLGTRQKGRLRNANVIDCPNFDPLSISNALNRALALAGPFENLYGDGRTSERLAEILPSLPLTDAVLAKSNTF